MGKFNHEATIKPTINVEDLIKEETSKASAAAEKGGKAGKDKTKVKKKGKADVAAAPSINIVASVPSPAESAGSGTIGAFQAVQKPPVLEYESSGSQSMDQQLVPGLTGLTSAQEALHSRLSGASSAGLEAISRGSPAPSQHDQEPRQYQGLIPAVPAAPEEAAPKSLAPMPIKTTPASAIPTQAVPDMTHSQHSSYSQNDAPQQAAYQSHYPTTPEATSISPKMTPISGPGTGTEGRIDHSTVVAAQGAAATAARLEALTPRHLAMSGQGAGGFGGNASPVIHTAAIMHDDDELVSRSPFFPQSQSQSESPFFPQSPRPQERVAAAAPIEQQQHRQQEKPFLVPQHYLSQVPESPAHDYIQGASPPPGPVVAAHPPVSPLGPPPPAVAPWSYPPGPQFGAENGVHGQVQGVEDETGLSIVMGGRPGSVGVHQDGLGLFLDSSKVDGASLFWLGGQVAGDKNLRIPTADEIRLMEAGAGHLYVESTFIIQFEFGFQNIN